MFTLAVGVVCVAVGLYAGKKRAKGASWCSISHDFCEDVATTSKSVWMKVSSPFKKDTTEDMASECPDFIDKD